MAQTNASYTNEYINKIAALDGDEQGKRRARFNIEHSTALYHGVPVDISYIPRLFNQDTYDVFNQIATTSFGILTKVMQRYLENASFREIFDFDERMQELILLPRYYDALLPFARVDIFFNEEAKTAKFCEFNGDGSSGMNENREIMQSIKDTPSYISFSKNHNIQTCDESLFQGWVEEFLNIYDTFTYKVKDPHVAIVDFLENAITEEFKIYVELFKARGIHATFCDMRDLMWDGTNLYDTNGDRIDAVWRRCVTNDVLEHWEHSQALINATKAHAIALIGSFAGHIVHDKQLFHLLFHERIQEILTDEEKDFIDTYLPYTTYLDKDHVDLDYVKQTRSSWILKPTDEYGSHGVVAGKDCTQDEWETIIDARSNISAQKRTLVQEYCTLFKTPALPLYGDEIDYTQDIQSYQNMSGLYIYNGRFAGVFSRLGPQAIISKATRGITAATLWVDCKPIEV